MKNRLEHMKEMLMGAIEAEMYNLNEADTKELGEAIDMVKDIEEALYYCTIVEAMQEGEDDKKKWKNHENEQMYYPVMYDTNNRDNPHRSYYNGNISSSSGNRNGNSSRSMYTEREMPNMFADGREGRSPHYRRMYMEAKETHQDKNTQIKELEKYMQELSQDITEMIEDATPEEKQLLSKRISVLSTKLSQLDD